MLYCLLSCYSSVNYACSGKQISARGLPHTFTGKEIKAEMAPHYVSVCVCHHYPFDNTALNLGKKNSNSQISFEKNMSVENSKL